MYGTGTEHTLNALIGTILTQNTSDILSSRSFSQLHREFDSGIHGPELRAADIDQIADLLAASGLQNSKARRIRQLLRLLHDENEGSVSLEFLSNAPRDKIHIYLSRFLGIGVQTIACIGLYNLEARDFAIDTHIYRFAVRFGWVPTFAFTETPPTPQHVTTAATPTSLVLPPPMLRPALPRPPSEHPPPLTPGEASPVMSLLADSSSLPRLADAPIEISSTPATASFSAVLQPSETTASTATSCAEVQVSGNESDATVDYDSDATEELDEADARAAAEEDTGGSSSGGYIGSNGSDTSTIEQEQQSAGTTTGEQVKHQTLHSGVSVHGPPSAAAQPTGRSSGTFSSTALGDIEDLGAPEGSTSSGGSERARFMRVPPITVVQDHIMKRFEVFE
jgi:endonuclease-3